MLSGLRLWMGVKINQLSFGNVYFMVKILSEAQKMLFVKISSFALACYGSNLKNEWSTLRIDLTQLKFDQLTNEIF